MKALIKLFLILSVAFSFLGCEQAAGSKSVILMIGDGMGYEQIKAASIYYYGEEGRLSFEDLPTQGSVPTYSADSNITDSAAAATAMATGHKVNNGVISKAIPGYRGNYKTILEAFQDKEKRTGIVTTTTVYHATPAAFTAHNVSRNNYSEIAEEIFTVTKPNVVFGGGGLSPNISTAWLQSAEYEIAETESEMYDLNEELSCALFGDTHMSYVYDGLGDYPTLTEMSLTALNLLDVERSGFFLMIEGGRIDHACHNNDLQRMIPEVKAFSDAVQSVINWIGSRDDILLIVTADHETGGLIVSDGNGIENLPTVTWSTEYHTGVNVPLFALGSGSDHLQGELDNTEIFDILCH